ncbi:MAG: ABC transporter ATP-binding protein [Candidatus Aenigmarchaeota archaeon]|nr:ABC transporter ATP-binding protein [Candidatus Aenigmarchaeota archaeon]
METVIELKDVSKVYDLDAVKVNALDKVSLKITKGQFISIIGPSGSGKSTMLHMLGALDKPTSGKVFIDGQDLSKLSDDELARLRGEKIGFVFQFFNLYPTLTAVENVELPMIIEGVDNDVRRERSLELLKLVGLEDRAYHLPAQLSGGQRQRVAIARALSNKPSFILADEPTGNLDSKSGKELIDMLIKLNKQQKTTIIIITHDEYIASHAKRIVSIKDGRIFKDRTTHSNGG